MDVARVAMWLCSEASEYVTGPVVPVDGGQSAGEKPERVYRPGKGMEDAAG